MCNNDSARLQNGEISKLKIDFELERARSTILKREIQSHEHAVSDLQTKTLKALRLFDTKHFFRSAEAPHMRFEIIWRRNVLF